MELTDTVRSQLVVRLDRESKDLEQYIAQNRARLAQDTRNKAILEQIERSRLQRIRNEELLVELMDKFNNLMDQQRFPEAVLVAKQAREIAPHEPAVQAMLEKSKIARQVVSNLMRNERFQAGTLASLGGVDDAGVPPEDDFAFPNVRKWQDTTKSRKDAMERARRRLSPAELAIQEALKKPVEVHFNNEPLGAVLDRLADAAGINLYLDPEGLTEEGVTSNTVVSLDLRNPISLRSALDLMLEPLHLSYVVDNEVLHITTEMVAAR